LLRPDLPDGHLRPPNRVRDKSNFAFPFKLIWVVQSVRQKFCSFEFTERSDYSRRPGPKEGTYRERHIRWAGDAVDADALTDERRDLWTAKSCGPGAPMLGAKLAMMHFALWLATVATAGSPGRARISRKTTARGRPECIRLYLWFSRSRKFLLRGSPGCSGHPAFPVPSAFREGEVDE
jgi:hypothetical protein